MNSESPALSQDPSATPSARIKLRRDHLDALRQALQEDFTLASLAQMLRTQFDVNLETIVSKERNLTETAAAVVDWAAAGSVGVKALLAAALAENPHGPHLSALAAQWQALDFDRVPACPYPGLLPFDATSARFFFGRDREVEQLRLRLRTQPLLVVIGPSASGKSSLLAAGLLPALAGQSRGAGQWTVRLLRPGDAPHTNLQGALAGLVDLPNRRLEEGIQPPLLVVVDQFEELFLQGAREAPLFFESLLALTRLDGVRVILALASEYFSHLQLSPIWGEAESQLVTILPLDADNLRAAIVKPAAAVGVEVEEALVERLAGEAAGAGGILPFLQETLVMLWQGLKLPRMTLDDYERIAASAGDGRSGLELAMAQHAAATLKRQELADNLTTVKRIFMRLIQFGEGHPHTRRRQTRESLAAGSEPQVVDSILAILVAERLLTSYDAAAALRGPAARTVAPPAPAAPAAPAAPPAPAAAGRAYDLAHDKLIVGWPQLGAWIAELESGETQRRRLEQKAAEHQRLGADGGLLDAQELKEAEHYLRSDAAAVLGSSASVAELVTASRRASNPGWHRWGAALLLAAALGMILWLGVLALAAFTLEPTVQLAVGLSVLAAAAVGAVVVWLAARARPHLLQHWTQWLGRRPPLRYGLAFCIGGGLLAYALLGVPLVRQVQYCQSAPRHFELRGGDAIHLALINEGLSTFNAGTVKDTLAAQPRIKAWLTTPDDAGHCSLFFSKVVHLRRLKTSAGEWSLLAEVSGLSDANQPRVFDDDCFDAQTLAYSIARTVDPAAVINLSAAGDGQAQAPERCEVVLLNNQAVDHILAGNLDAAQALLAQAIQLAPDYDTAYGSLGDVLSHKGDVPGAVTHYTKAAELDPFHSVHRYKLADAYHTLYLFTADQAAQQQAEQHYRETMALDASFPLPYNGLASLYISAGLQLDEAGSLLARAAALLERSTEFEPYELAVYQAAVAKNQGRLSLHQQDYARAVEFLLRADELSDMFDRDALEGLGDAYAAQGQAQAACAVRLRLHEWYQTHGRDAPVALLDHVASCQS